MKKSAIIVVSLVLAGTLLAANGQQDTGYGQGAGMGMGRGNGAGRGAAGQNGGTYGLETRFTEDLTSILNDTESSELSAAESEGLIFMREEEKLARDVYAALYETWNLPIFRNISQSEQQHMDSIKLLLDRYDIADPVGSDTAGVFENKDLKGLYDELTVAGRSSIVAALNVGATIEDLDIRDLQNEIGRSDNDDINILYQNLMKGSRNHLRSFDRQLEREGESYTAQYISGEYLSRILSLNQEMAPITDPDYIL